MIITDKKHLTKNTKIDFSEGTEERVIIDCHLKYRFNCMISDLINELSDIINKNRKEMFRQTAVLYKEKEEALSDSEFNLFKEEQMKEMQIQLDLMEGIHKHYIKKYIDIVKKWERENGENYPDY